jgi:hypothetical protein
MGNDLPIAYLHDEMERNAYNAAFYELGLRWHWDRDTYSQLLRRGADAADRIRHYLETHQPHLLRAYDATFLAHAIQEKKAEHSKRRPASGDIASCDFDWAETLGGELGA